MQMNGNIVAPTLGNWKGEVSTWLVFSGVKGLVVVGNGQIDGQGSDWWRSCPLVGMQAGKCMRPSALTFNGCSNVEVNGLRLINSARNHISVTSCNNLVLSNLNIVAPSNSPNTDGIDISRSTAVTVLHTNIATGDDCIAINSQSININITGVSCGPGHGISVGSLGLGKEPAKVEGVYVKNCSFIGTQNGARIKSWPDGSGYANNITFEDITLVRAGNPILIDQFYCPKNICQLQEGVSIVGATFRGFRGTSSVANVINLRCSTGQGCIGLLFQHINISSNPQPFATCQNAHGKAFDSFPPITCLLP